MANLEEIKADSRHLRGTIGEVLTADTTHFEETDAQLLKFHGIYQQDDRDSRAERRRKNKEKEYFFMIRCKVPGGALTAEQYLVLDRLAGQMANGTLRITSRQGIQLHGVLKDDLKETLALITRSGITTWGACGDVVRNVMAVPAPFSTPVHRQVKTLARELAHTFAARSAAYSEIWLDGQKLEFGQGPDETDPIYGQTWLPRKFKIGLAIPPRNDVDIYTHDVGFIAHIPNGELEGYTVLAGGGLGMSYNKKHTYPRLSSPLFYVRKEDAAAAAVAIVTTQRDFGNRRDRTQARLKYLIDKNGIGWMRRQVESRLSAPTQDPKPFTLTVMDDPLGWHEQGDGKLFCGVKVQGGRIKDYEKIRFRRGFRVLAERFDRPIQLTPNVNILFCDIDPADRDAFDAVLDEHGIPGPETYTNPRRTAMACVALPTCGLALSESERAFPPLMDTIDRILRDLGLETEPILFRMTGCPNGCSRPYNADFGFVGKGPGKYAVFVGGSHLGDRLARLEKQSVKVEEIPGLVRGHLEAFVANRRDGETFTDYWHRTHPHAATPDPSQFHVELNVCQ